MMWQLSDGDQMDGWTVAVAVILHSSSTLSLATPEDWTPQTPLDWIQEKASWYLHTELVLIKSAKIEIFHSLLYLMVFINEYTLLSFPFTSVVHSGYICWYTVLIFWSITLMVRSYDDYVSNNSLLFDCSQLIKRGKGLLKPSTLIHPPSQCQQLAMTWDDPSWCCLSF